VSRRKSLARPDGTRICCHHEEELNADKMSHQTMIEDLVNKLAEDICRESNAYHRMKKLKDMQESRPLEVTRLVVKKVKEEECTWVKIGETMDKTFLESITTLIRDLQDPKSRLVMNMIASLPMFNKVKPTY